MWCSVAGKYVLKCLLSPDVRQLATASADNTVKLWNLDGFTLERTLTGRGLHTCQSFLFLFFLYFIFPGEGVCLVRTLTHRPVQQVHAHRALPVSDTCSTSHSCCGADSCLTIPPSWVPLQCTEVMYTASFGRLAAHH